MTESHTDFREAELPRWIQILAGLILGIFTLICSAALFIIIFARGKKVPSPVLAFLVFAILLAGCLWVLVKCIRLVTGRKNRGGLLGPTALRAVAYCLPLFAIGGLFTGFYREHGWIAIFQGVMYFFGFFGLRAMAQKREQNHDKETTEDQPRR